MNRVLLPPDYQQVTGPLLFLAGPIKGAADWQSQAIAYLHEREPTLTIASPRTVRATDAYSATFSEDQYIAQAEWEHRHLEQAMWHGLVLFWFAPESQHFCDRAYAQTTRVEFGDALCRASQGQARLVVGGTPEYPGYKYARWRLQRLLPQAPFFPTLEETCLAALALLP